MVTYKKIGLFFERTAVFAFLLVILATYIACMHKVVVGQLQVDTLIFYCSAKNFWQHQSIYWSICSTHFLRSYVMDPYVLSLHNSVDQLGANYLKNLNSPVLVLFLLPWGLVSYNVGASVWHALILIANGLAVWLLYQGFFAQKSKYGYCVLLSLYLASAPAYIGTASAEVGGFFFLALVAIWFWARKADDAKAGILLGFALSIKYFFGLFLILFFLQKRWRLMGFTLISFLFWNLLAFLVFGPESFIQYGQILHQVSWFAVVWNGSLYGFLSAIGTVVVAQKIFIARWASAVYYILTTCMIGYQYYLCRERFAQQADFDSAFAYTVIITLLICPLAWIYYFSFLLMPLLMILCVLIKKPLMMRLIFVYLFSIFLLSIPFHVSGIALGSIGDIVVHRDYSGFFIGVLLLGVLWQYAQVQRKDAVLSIQDRSQLLPWILISYPVAFFSFRIFVQYTFLSPYV